MRTYQVAVVVVSYNTRELLLECLASVRSSSDTVEIVVVDNASVDRSAESVRHAHPNVRLICNEVNVGFGAACNQGIRQTSAPFILLLNSDARLTAEALAALLGCMEDDARCGAAGCAVADMEGRPVITTMRFLNALNQSIEMLGILKRTRLGRTHRPRLDSTLRDCTVDWVEGSCMVLRRQALDQAGMFDERFFMYSEDEDFCWALRKHGWHVCYTAAGSVSHKGGASAAQDPPANLRHFYASQLRFLRKNRGGPSERLYLISTRAALVLKCLWARARGQAEWRERVNEQLHALLAAAAAERGMPVSR